MSIETEIIRRARNDRQSWAAELAILGDIMSGTIGTNAQRNALRRIIKQHAAELNQQTPAQTYAALKKVAEISRLPGLLGEARPKLQLGQFINSRNSEA